MTTGQHTGSQRVNVYPSRRVEDTMDTKKYRNANEKGGRKLQAKGDRSK